MAFHLKDSLPKFKGQNVKIKEVASWVFEVKSEEKTWGKLRRMQLEERYEPEDCRRIAQCYWQKRSEWKFHQDILPEEELEEIKDVILAVEEENGIESEETDQIFGTLSRSSRKRLKKALEKMKICEVYLEPRVAAQGERSGCEAGTSFDLKTEYDFTHREDRQRAWKKIREKEDPDLVVVWSIQHFARMELSQDGEEEGHDDAGRRA